MKKDTKICNKCSIRQPIENFIEDSTIKGGRGKICEMCRSKILHKLRQSLPDSLTSRYEFVDYINSQYVILRDYYASYKMTAGSLRLGAKPSMLSAIDKTEYFVKTSAEVHKDKYSYEKTNYSKNNIQVTITCPIHGDFEQTPQTHSAGRGCNKCANDTIGEAKRFTIEYWKDKSLEIHSNKYNYDLSCFKTMADEVIIICPTHGEFKQLARHHIAGHGCSKCGKDRLAKNQLIPIEEHIKDFIAVHGDRYDYSKAEKLTKIIDKITITCSMHGDFNQIIRVHKNGSNCPSCAKVVQRCTYYGKSEDEAHQIPCSTYIYRFYNENESFYKVGISSSINYRKSKFATIYKVEDIYEYKTNIFEAVNLEQKVLKDLAEFRYIPQIKFEGETECLSINPIEYLKKVANDFSSE